MNRRFEVVIVGAGMTGLASAALLARSPVAKHLSIRVVDANSRPQFDTDGDVALRVSAIANGSANLLRTVGAWDYIAARRHSPFIGMQVWDERDDADSGHALVFDAAEFAVPALGAIIENALVRCALLDVIETLPVRLEFDAPLDRLPEADLVIAADGANSFVRTQLGITTSEWPYQQTAVVTHLRPQHSHGAIARQRFLRDGPLGILPLADGRVSVVWSTTAEIAAAALDADDDELGAMLTDASDYVLGDLQVAGERAAFPLRARHASRYVETGVALVGDAAHAIHPLAGQGANLGFQDAQALVDTLVAAVRRGEYPGDRPVLRRYERARKGPNSTMLHAMTGLNRLFATDSSLLGELRSLGMSLFNRSGPLRANAVRIALGVD